jgi:hypothetical protein
MPCELALNQEAKWPAVARQMIQSKAYKTQPNFAQLPYFVWILPFNQDQLGSVFVITNEVLYQLSYSGTFLVWLCYGRGHVR